MSKLKRLLAPEFWKIPKKISKWAVAPRPGPHRKFESIPMQILVRDILKLVETGKEAKRIIKSGEVLVDGKIRKDHAYPVGLMDVVSIPKIKKHYRIVPISKGLGLIEISEEESKLKMCRIENKTVVKKGKLQLNLHDGRNTLVDKNEYGTGDSVLIEIPSQKIIEHVRMDKGSLGLIVKGKNTGKTIVINNVVVTRSREPNKVVCEIEGKKTEVIKDYVFVIGSKEPLIKLSG